MNKTALVFGSKGQDGSFICKSLLEKNYKVIGVSRSKSNISDNHGLLNIQKNIIYEVSNLNNFKKVTDIIETYQPDEIYNFAAQSSVNKSFKAPQETIEGIINGTLNLLEVVRRLEYSGRIFFAGSSEMFGNTETGADINHQHQPINPYAIGKQTSFNLVKLYREIYNLKCMTGVLFNHESSLRPKTFVTQKIINAAKNISKGNITILKLGNINVIRDWGWAPEYVEAIQLIAQSKVIKDHVICTGEANSLKKFVEIVFQCFKLDWRKYTEIDNSLFRPNEITKSYGNPKPLLKELGWQANMKLESIIETMVKS